MIFSCHVMKFFAFAPIFAFFPGLKRIYFVMAAGKLVPVV